MGERNGNGNGRHVLRGMLAGAGAGLAASWVMNVFAAGPGRKLQESLRSGEDRLRDHLHQMDEQEHGGTKLEQDATMKAADALVSAATGGRHLSMEERQKAGPVVHYGFGALVGGLYGGLAEYSETVKKGCGTAFGGALFAGADLIAAPALRLSPPLAQTRPKSLANPLATHLVYGATTELLRRAFRALL